MNGVEVTGMPAGYGIYLLQTLIALGAVCLLAYVVIRYGLKRLYGAGRQGERLRVLEHLPLEPRRSIYLVEVAGKQLLIGTSEGGVSLLSEVEVPADQGHEHTD